MMKPRKYIVGIFDDDHALVHAVEHIRHGGEKISDVVTPFPVHGLDQALGLKESRLHIAGFLYGLFGTTSMFSFISWIYTSNWPINYGGKPHFAVPAWVPITFEFTVLCAGVGMFLTMLLRNHLYPGRIRESIDPRTTDDKFAVIFRVHKTTTPEQIEKWKSVLNSNGAKEIFEKELKKKY